jgi:Tol biopolymer transport system component
LPSPPYRSPWRCLPRRPRPGANGKLVFERPTGNGAEVFSIASDGSGLTQLSDRRGVEGDSSWSPDGTKIVFACAKNPERRQFEICVVDADGSGFTQLTRHRTFSIAPTWSPDGTKILYATLKGPGDHLRLRVMNADGSGQQWLTREPPNTYSQTDPSWSPDGATIALALIKSGETPRAFDSSLALIDANDGGNLRRMTPRGGPDELNPN